MRIGVFLSSPCHVCWLYLPCKIQDTESVNVRLVRGRSMHAMHARLDVPARQRRQRVARVDGDGRVLRLDPLPLAFRVENLQRTHRLSEQQRYAAQVRMAGAVQLAHFLVVLGAARCVVHVPQVVLALVVVEMVTYELVF